MTSASAKKGCFSDPMTPCTVTRPAVLVRWLCVYEMTIAATTPMASTTARPIPSTRLMQWELCLSQGLPKQTQRLTFGPAPANRQAGGRNLIGSTT